MDDTDATTEINENDLVIYRYLLNTGTVIDDIPEPYKTALGGTNVTDNQTAP